jgi:hypothetical protein
MSLKQYTERRTDEQDGSQVLGHNHREVAEKQLIPRIILRNRQAIQVDPHHFWFYQRKKQGLRCSCFAIESSPDGLCQVCFGTGVVGGYEKFGTTSEMLDTTYPRINAVNVRQGFEMQTRPVLFSLADGAIRGYVEFEWEIRPSRKRLDIFQVMSRQVGHGAYVEPFIRTPREEGFVAMNENSINERLCDHKAIVRVVLRRDNPDCPMPALSHVYLRYKLIDDPRVRMDVPRVPESITLAEYGIFDSFSTMTGWLTDEVKSLSTEDFFKRIHDGTYWKSIEENPNRPLLQTTSHDVTLRLVQEFEAYKRFP